MLLLVSVGYSISYSVAYTFAYAVAYEVAYAVAYVAAYAVAYEVACVVAYAVAYEIAYTAAYVNLHLIFDKILRKWETTFWGNERQQQQQQKPLPRRLRFADAALKICLIIDVMLKTIRIENYVKINVSKCPSEHYVTVKSMDLVCS